MKRPGFGRAFSLRGACALHVYRDATNWSVPGSGSWFLLIQSGKAEDTPERPRPPAIPNLSEVRLS